MSLSTPSPRIRPTLDRKRDLLTLEELRQLTGWGRTATYQRAREDGLPFPVLRSGRKLYVSRRAYERWLNGEDV